MKRDLIASALLILPALALAGFGWMGTDTTTQIPVHWGLDGQPDRHGGRVEAFLLLPAIMIVLTGVFAILPLVDPRGRNLQRSRVVLDTVRLGVLTLLLFVQGILVSLGLNWIGPDEVTFVPTLILSAVGALYVLLGNVLGKARPNWFVGIRTRWTLSSDLSWDKTHRLTGRLMVAGGLVLLAGVWALPPERQIWLVLVSALTPAAIGIVYSFLVWRSDPTRQTLTPDDVT
ncbi:SdpI family protein [Maricaulis sp.]|uniref:SdpI family protein n=1 Tax=Maricaulis sp. TaxID=1486257 RepID=UPI002B26B484|nr:SdpI family protein [Maricaulis sp.]